MATGCVVCKKGLANEPGPVCGECQEALDRRADRRKGRQAPEGQDESALGLGDLEEVLKKDQAKIQQVAAKRASLSKKGKGEEEGE